MFLVLAVVCVTTSWSLPPPSIKVEVFGPKSLLVDSVQLEKNRRIFAPGKVELDLGGGLVVGRNSSPPSQVFTDRDKPFENSSFGLALTKRF